jgi:hypothetical protein
MWARVIPGCHDEVYLSAVEGPPEGLDFPVSWNLHAGDPWEDLFLEIFSLLVRIVRFRPSVPASSNLEAADLHSGKDDVSFIQPDRLAEERSFLSNQG